MIPLLLLEGGLLSVDTGLFWWVLITFVLFIFLIKQFAWGPILSALAERELNIKKSLEAAEKALAQAKDVAEQNARMLHQAEQDAHRIRREAAEQAEVMRAAMVEKAKAEAEKLIADARKAIAIEQKAAFEKLRAEVSALVIMAAEKVLRSEINAEKNKKLVEDFVGKLTRN
jgi:F-type H+-transporting ATPase subunit b